MAKRKMIRLLIASVAAVAAFGAQLPVAYAETATPTALTMFSADTSSLLDVPAEARDQMRLQEAPIEKSEAESLATSVPVTAPDAHSARLAFATADALYVADVYTSTGAVEVAVNAVDRLTGAVTEIVDAQGTIAGDAMTGTSSSQFSGQRMSVEGVVAAGCEHCEALGAITGIAFNAIPCAVGGFAGLLICGIVGVGLGYAAENACKARNNCNAATPPSMHFVGAVCGLAYCDIRINVRNAGRQLTSIGTQLHWYYPTGFCAPLNGVCRDAYSEGSSFLPPPFFDFGNGTQQYAYRYNSNAATWTNCSVQEMLSVTTTWSDSNFKSTGFLNGPKPGATTCPGFRSYYA